MAPVVVINATRGGADWAVTAEAGIRLAHAAARRDIRLVHVSSDAVFSGAARDRYDESCLPDPLASYGAAKAAAGVAALQAAGMPLWHAQAVLQRTPQPLAGAVSPRTVSGSPRP